MPSKVTLKITEGPMAGRDFDFDQHESYFFGQSEDCQVCLADPKVSRHHLILEVNPPDACVRDLGSLNGTFVNNEKHGGRERHETPEEGAKKRHPEVALKDGDVIRIGDTTLTVHVETSKYCCECGRELSGSMAEECLAPGGIFVCPDCKAKAAAADRPAKKPEPVRCKKCGRDVSKEVGAGRRGDYVCASCRGNLEEFIRAFLQRAKAGDRNLVAVRGYSILKELGKGGMGAVYLARHDETGKQVALKVMLPQVAANKRSIASFQREVEVSKALKHNNVVEMWEHGCSDGTFFFTLEFCDGGSVDKLMLKHGGRLSVSEVGKIILDVLEGLEYAHRAQVTVKLKDGTMSTANGVVHRDLSPHNIFLTDSGSGQVAKVADFGLAKAFEKAGLSGNTRTGMISGKPLFVPRQQVINYKFAKPEVDVWAAAATLYNMLTGLYPRDFELGGDPWRIPLHMPCVPIRKRNPAIPQPLADVIDEALIDKPEIPIKTAAELRHRLERVL